MVSSAAWLEPEPVSTLSAGEGADAAFVEVDMKYTVFTNQTASSKDDDGISRVPAQRELL